MNPIRWNDSWTGPDKVGHFRHGLVFAAGTTIFFGLLWTASLTLAVGAGVAVAAAAGALKEGYDLFAEGRTPSPQDFLATVAGGVVGALGSGAVVAGIRSLA